MGLSKHIKETLEENYSTIISDVPFTDILLNLRCVKVLSDQEVSRLKKCFDNKETGFEFICILQTRSDKNFFDFCDTLKDSQIENVQNLGLELETKANEKNQIHG